MKKQIFLLVVIVALIAASCGSGGQKAGNDSRSLFITLPLKSTMKKAVL
jgi:hypothetical protein